MRLLHSSKLGFSDKKVFQCDFSIFSNCAASTSGGYLANNFDNIDFPSGCN